MLVLIVEDNAEVALLMQMLIRQCGHKTVVANDPEAAVQACERAKPEFVLMDIGLPGMDGYDLAIRLRRDCAIGNVPIYAVSAYPDDADRRQEAGIAGHIRKPISFAEIQQLVGC